MAAFTTDTVEHVCSPNCLGGGGKEAVHRWLRPPRGAWGWSALAILVGLIPLQLFLQNWKLFDSFDLVLLSLLLIVINPFLEEGYWRGLLLDQMQAWPGWLSVVYSSFFFAIDHPLTFGVFSIANRHPVTFISTFIMGVVWAIAYKKTGSLRWLIVGHLLVDIFNLSVLAILNVFVPQVMR
ncbi:MAG: CPBP family intramembrane metalloprotease [Anaerolineales bacterium]|nr:CPBP family intramembrane metalloprotease [Anaerolineales bacterium]